LMPRRGDVMRDAVAFSLEARRAAIGGTRQMIAEDSFDALVALLVDRGMVPRAVMADTLQKLADLMTDRARGNIASGYVLFAPEVFARAKVLASQSQSMRN
jgi:hypothetical protein